MKNLSDLLPNLLLIPAACISLPALAVDSNELPTNGVIGAGTGSISQSSRELQVNQSSNNLIVNWNSFNIGADAHVNFTQPSSNSVALNRIVGTDASQIFGSLTANGKLFLINPNGVLFGRNARVDVGGLVASTLNLSDTDFLAGRYTFNADGTAGAVKNEGSIHAADNGYVALLGRHVINDGVIVARLGTVALAAGDRITLDVGGDGLINLAVDRATVDAYATNRNLIQADGGRVLMSAKAADDVAGTVVNNEGIIQARSLTQRNGVIILEGGDAGIVSVSGTLDVSGQAAGQSGGSVTVLGQKVGLFDAAHIDASGNAGGGVVLIGGNYHGTGPEPNATQTYVGADTTINADALVSGDGGRVIVWSDDITRFAGHISARGGALQGNGGFVEVSGKQDLLFTGLADLSAAHGSVGTLLLDPADITIAVGGLDSVLPNSGFANNPLGSVTLAPVNILAELLLANLTLQASNDITVNSPVNALSLLSNNTLSLEAGRSIAINADISLLGGFNATVNDTAAIAANRSAGAAAFTMAAGTTINTATNNGNITITMGTGPGAGSPSGNITLANLNAGGGSVVITNNGATSGSGIVAASGSDVITAASAAFNVVTGNISLATNVAQLTVSDAGGNVTLSNAAALDIGTSAVTGNLSLTTAGALTDSGAVTVSGTTTLAAGANNIVLDQAGNNFNTVTLTSVANATLVDANAIDLGAVTASGNLNVTATAGNITNSGALAIGGNSSFTANQAGASISVNNAANNFGGTVSFAGSGGLANVSVADTTALDLSALTLTNNLNVTAAGITQSGNLVVGGTATLAAGANNITLNQTGNNFSAVNVTSANNVVLRDANAIDLGASNITGNLNVTTAGAITDSGALAVSGTTTLAAGAGNNITLDNADNFATLGITSANNVVVNDINALVLAAATVSGNLNVTVAGALTQSGALTVAGTSSFSVGANAITLTNASNDFTGAVALANSGANNVAITDTNAIQLGTSSVGSGMLTVNAVGITQTGPITQAASAEIVTFNAGTGALTLTNTSNDFTGAVVLNTTSSAAVTDTNSLDLGASTIAGNLNVTTGGALTDSGALTVSGSTTLTVGTGNNITLDNTDDFNTVAIVSGNNVVLNDVNAIGLGASTVSGNLNVTTGGAMTQSGAITVAGTSNINVGANAITLTNSSNDFTGAVALTNSGANNVAITDANAIQLGTSSLGSGALTVNAVGITQTGAITQAAGAGIATFNAGAGVLTLTNASNDFAGAVSLNTTSNAAITDVNALNLGASNITGSLNVTTGGALTDSGVLTISGTTTLTAGTSNNITLDNADDFNTVAIVNGNNVALNDVNAINLGASAVTGNLNVTTNGALNQNGALIIAGTSSFSAGANTITLTNVSNDFTGAVALANSGANNVAITDTNAIQLGTVSVGNGTLTVNAVGITQTGPITQAAGAGIATFNASAGVLTLTNTSNDFTGAVALNTTSGAAVTDTNALNLGASTVTGNLNVTAGGALTQSGAIAVAGTSNINVGANVITLTNASNDFSGAISLTNSGANAVAITDANAIQLGTVSLGSGTLTVNAAGITQIGPITQAASAGAATFNAGAGTLTLTNASNDFTGAVSLNTTSSVAITDVNALNIGTSNITGNLTVTTSGALTDSGSVSVSGITTLTAGAGNNITLDNADDFATVSVVSGNNVTLNDINALNLGAVTVAGNINVTTSGALSQSGTLTVTGTSNFNTGANAITLTNASNDFSGAVSLTNSGANTITITDANAIQLGTVSVGSGALTVNAVGITQTGPITQAASAGTATFNAGTGALTLTNASNDFTGAVTLNTTNSAAITDLNALNLGTSTISGNLNVVTNGAITDSGALTIAGATTLTAGTGNNITLDNADDFGTVGVISGNNVTLNDINALALAASTISGSLNVTTSGALTQSGAMTIAGTSNFNTGAGAITLTNTSNDFVGATVLTTTNSAAITDANALNLGAVTVTGNLNVTTGGAMTDSGVLTVAGTTTLTAGAGNNITLDNANDFGTVAIVSGNNTVLNDINSLNLGASTVSGNLSVTAGPLMQSGALTVAGTSSFNAGANAITLTNASNNFTGAVSLTSSGANNVALTDTNGIQLGAASLGSGTLTVNAVGITQSGPIVQAASAGAATFNSGTGALTLTNASNDFTGAVTLNTTSSAAITDVNALNLGTSSISGNLNAVANGTITDSGALTVAGVTTLTAGAGNNITLDNADDFATISIVSGNDVTLNDINALTLGTSTVSGTLNITTSGALTNSGALTIAGNTTLAAGATHDISLNNAANNFSGAVTVISGNNVTLVDANTLTLGGIEATGALNVTTTAGDITAGGALNVDGTAAFTANQAGASINVTNTGNHLLGAVSLSGTGGLANASVSNATALDLQALTLSGNLTVTAAGINQVGAWVVGGTTTLAAGANNIVLGQSGNNFNTVSIVSAHGVAITDSNALDLGAATITGDMSITTNGAITDSGALSVAGITTLAAGSGNNITLDNANDFATISIDSGNDVTLNDGDALSFGTSSIAGNLNVTTNGALMQSGALTVAGTSSIHAGANAITLANTANDFTGAVSLNNSGANNVTIADANALQLGTSSLGSGTLTVNAVGITQTAPIIQASGAGTATFNSGAGAIALTNVGNDFSGAVSLSSGSNVSITVSNGLNLDASTVGGNLNALVATGDITNSGALIIGGDTSLTANQAGASIHVNNATNQFGGSVVFAGAGGLANVGITDTTALDLSALHLSGNLDVTASSISESGDLVVAGATTLNTGTGGITLDRVGNDFNSVSVISAHDVVLNDSNAIVLGGVAISGNLSVMANGSITDSGVLVVAGATTLAAGSGNNITLDNADDFASIAIVSGNNVALTDVNALTLGTVNVSGDLTTTAGGNVTGSTSLTVAGATIIAAGTHDVIVDNAANALTGPIAVTGRNVVLANALAIDLGAIHASGNLQVTAGGTITDSTALTVAGTTDISTGASGATITLDNASTYGGAVSLSTHLANISLSNVVGDLTLGTIIGDVVTLSATHSILNGIGAGSNIDAATDATLIATTGTIGLADNAIRVSAPTVLVSAGGTAQDFSVNLEGHVADKTIHLLDTPAGLVVLNGTLIGAAISPTDPIVFGVNPASGQGAVVNAVTSLNNANSSSDRALPASTAGSLQGLVYPTGHARTEMTYGCGEIRQIDSLVVNIDFAMKLPSGVFPMLEQQDRLLRDTDRGQKNTCRYRGT